MINILACFNWVTSLITVGVIAGICAAFFGVIFLFDWIEEKFDINPVVILLVIVMILIILGVGFNC